MNFQNLEYFLVVAEEMNVTRAAERLHLSQQALSGHIIRLEEEVGCPLFDRKPTLALTYAGECFRNQALQMLNLKYQSESMMRDIRANEKVAVLLGTEGTGLPKDVIAACDYRVMIPMYHGVDSLNVAAASAISFWELMKP